MMNKEEYERTALTVTEFDAEDVITTSDIDINVIPDEYEGSVY